MRLTRSLLALLAVLALVLAACPAEDDPEAPDVDDPEAEEPEDTDLPDLEGVQIVFSTHLAEEEIGAVRSVLDSFEELTGASVDMTGIATEDLPDRLEVDVEADRASIHLFAVDNLALGTLVDRELVQETGDVEVPDEVIEAMIPPQFDGADYFLPYRPNVQLHYVNQERLEEAGHDAPPETLEELEELLTEWREMDGAGKYTIQLAEGPPAGVGLSEWIVRFGGNPVVLNDEGSIEALEKLQEMWQDELFARETLTAKFDTQIDYLVGEVAFMAPNWPFTSDVLNEQGLLDRFAIYPGWAGPEGEAYVIGGEVLGIPANVEGDELEGAIALAEYLMTQEAQEILVAQNAWPSIRDDALAEVPDHLTESFEAIQTALENGYYRPSVPYWDAAQDAMNEAVDRILEGGEDVQEVADDLHEQIADAAERADAEYPPADDQ
jgi:trehalose transport system substrate-binding protein